MLFNNKYKQTDKR